MSGSRTASTRPATTAPRSRQSPARAAVPREPLDAPRALAARGSRSACARLRRKTTSCCSWSRPPPPRRPAPLTARPPATSPRRLRPGAAPVPPTMPEGHTSRRSARAPRPDAAAASGRATGATVSRSDDAAAIAAVHGPAAGTPGGVHGGRDAAAAWISDADRPLHHRHRHADSGARQPHRHSRRSRDSAIAGHRAGSQEPGRGAPRLFVLAQSPRPEARRTVRRGGAARARLSASPRPGDGALPGSNVNAELCTCTHRRTPRVKRQIGSFAGGRADNTSLLRIARWKPTRACATPRS